MYRHLIIHVCTLCIHLFHQEFLSAEYKDDIENLNIKNNEVNVALPFQTFTLSITLTCKVFVYIRSYKAMYRQKVEKKL